LIFVHKIFIHGVIIALVNRYALLVGFAPMSLFVCDLVERGWCRTFRALMGLCRLQAKAAAEEREHSDGAEYSHLASPSVSTSSRFLRVPVRL
jgi:hypothetical protein